MLMFGTPHDAGPTFKSSKTERALAAFGKDRIAFRSRTLEHSLASKGHSIYLETIDEFHELFLLPKPLLLLFVTVPLRSIAIGRVRAGSGVMYLH
jgi:hypothetical protein